MRWRYLGALTVVLVVAIGCESHRRALPLLSAAEDDSAVVLRSQKPEASPPQSMLQLTSGQSGEPVPGDVTCRILATVGNVPLLEDEVKDNLLRYIGSLPREERVRYLSSTGAERARLDREFTDQVLEQLIDREVVLQEAFRRLNQYGQKNVDKLKDAAGKEFEKRIRYYRKENNLSSEEEVREFFRKQGTSLDAQRRQTEREFMYWEYLRFMVGGELNRIGHREIVDYYQQHPEEFQTTDGVQWQDIFLDAGQYPSREAARQFAEQLMQMTRAGEDFAKLAEQYDHGETRFRKGEGTGKRRGEIRPVEAEPLLFQMRDGDMRLVELGTGFHVIRLVKREHAGLTPLDSKTQALVLNKLKSDLFRRESRRLIDRLRRTTAIEKGNVP